MTQRLAGARGVTARDTLAKKVDEALWPNDATSAPTATANVM